MIDYEKDFRDAFYRLKRGEPTNKSLIRKLKIGKLKITISSVSTEANHSRTLLSIRNSPYTTIRELISNHNGKKASAKVIDGSSAEGKSDLELSQVKKELQLVYEENAHLILKLTNANEKISRLEERLRRSSVVKMAQRKDN